MTQSKTYAWIFLSVGEQPTPLWDVISMADGINRIIPMMDELQRSLGWLQAQGLVTREDKTYFRTPAGIALRKSVEGGNIFDIMDRTAEAFAQLPSIEYQPDDITEKELRAAYKKMR